MLPEKTGPTGKPPALRALRHSLFLDFDGTLVDIVDRPDCVVVEPSLVSLLQHLSRTLDERLAIVSGRSVTQLDHFLGTTGRALTLVGSHGGEIRLAGAEAVSQQRPKALAEAELLFRAAFANHPGMVIEVKTLGVAVHYRMEPMMEDAAKTMAMDFAEQNRLELQHGKMMVELRTPGHDKGIAIASLLAQAPFAGHVPVFVGDDLTDEAGFTACAASGGFGILVGPPRKTAALYRLDDTTAVHQWLAAP